MSAYDPKRTSVAARALAPTRHPLADTQPEKFRPTGL